MREFSAHGLMVIDQIEGKQSRPTLLNLDSGFRPSSSSPQCSLHPPASTSLVFMLEILYCQVRVGYGLFVIDIIVGICNVVCPVMIVILFVLCRTIIVKYVVIKNIEKIVMK